MSDAKNRKKDNNKNNNLHFYLLESSQAAKF